ncbi:MAG: UbiD family decarboxylase [Rhodospirillales bacterium]|jgi:4-hydroxy-3-polyprenylbenzoate decarboxylase|nr:carboxylase [Rhodospirillaceae bacterium]MDP6428616.1 UbiD family decarboxylase [Rhodospirillales bacterium]MDP6645029.1 UbiD family decarboxylase [Rhodospirillales bacterium]
MGSGTRSYRDLQEHLEALSDAGLVHRIGEKIDKDAEMHPLVRWQFRGGINEAERKAFLFTDIVDGKGRAFDIPVAVGALAASQAVYSVGMLVPVAEISGKWDHALANPIAPREIENAPCHEVVLTGSDLEGEGNGLDALPIPVSTPGFDSAPTLTATNVITRDPETGGQNMGTYRAGLKATDRLVVRMATRTGGAEGYLHWQKYKGRGEDMPCAIVLGCPPFVAFMGPQKLPLGIDEMEVAGGLAGEPINMVRAKTVDLMVPAEAELVIEGIIDPHVLEPEGPFGESHGHIALEEFNMPMRVTAITRKAKPVIPSYISQVTPSESSTIKRVAYEPLFLAHLRDGLGIRGVKGVALHEPLTSLLRVTILTIETGVPKTEIWRALNGAAAFKSDMSKIVVAVNDDISPENADALLWAISYRSNPVEDMNILAHRGLGHGPKREHGNDEDGTLLIDATMKSPMPPLALPARQYMERAKEIWERLQLPPLKPEAPWHGYSLGDWTETWEEDARRAAAGNYLDNGAKTLKRQQPDLVPETSVRDIEDGWD